MRVAFLSFDFGEYCVRLAGALAQHAEVMLVLPQQEKPSDVTVPSHVRLSMFHKPRLRQPWRQMRLAREILRRVHAYAPDVVHLQQGHLWFNLALPLLSHVPLVLTVHDPTPHPGDDGARKTLNVVRQFGFRCADQLIVHGRSLKRLLTRDGRIAKERVHVIPHIALGDGAARPDIEEREHQILFFGRIWGYKGLEYLIRAAPSICSRVRDARIVIAGQGESFERYRLLMKDRQQFVVYNEYIPGETQSELFRQSSLVVLPYVEASQSGVIPLAYTFSKPVVATTVGALPEMVEDGRTGLLVPPREVEALADAIVRLLLDSELRRRMGAAGKKKIDGECAPENVARQTLTVYRAAIDAHVAPARCTNRPSSTARPGEL